MGGLTNTDPEEKDPFHAAYIRNTGTHLSVYLYIYVYIYMYIYIYIYVCVWVYVYVYARIYQKVHIFIYVYIYVHMYTCVYVSELTSVDTHDTQPIVNHQGCTQQKPSQSGDVAP